MDFAHVLWLTDEPSHRYSEPTPPSVDKESPLSEDFSKEFWPLPRTGYTPYLAAGWF
jgi:hypothetical protein